MYESKDNFYIKSNGQFGEEKLTTLVIKRNNPANETAIFEMDDVETKSVADNSLKEQFKIYGLIGIMLINGEKYLCVISEVANIGISYDKKPIFLIVDVKFFPLNTPQKGVESPVKDKN